MTARITIDDLDEARARGVPVVLETPTLPSASFSRLTGAEVFLKAENLQRTGSFKIRGAMNAIGLLDDDVRGSGVVAASAGNHAQGVALAAAEYGARCTVFMPENAAIPKVAATRAYGADVVLAGESLADATDHAEKMVAETGGAFIHPFDDPAIIAGQGTLGLELVEQVPDADTVVIPVGGGGLISGAAIALKHHNPDIRIIGVQSSAVPTYVTARAKGRPERIDYRPTVSDGIAVSRPSDLCFQIIEDAVDDLIAVDDDITTEAVALLLERAKYLVEPSGAVGVAALMHGLIDDPGRTVIVLSGGNIDLLVLDSVVRHGLETRGRYAALRVVVPDEPGNLAALLTTIGEQQGNVLSVAHRREGAGLDYGAVEIMVSLETRGPDHVTAILEALSGYEVSTIHDGRTSASP
ncbi:MAG: threonine ammonia-lyase [Acidimicrobiia bacterium]|nr:threonine ammonia-lyase [Acidimicrobiia bacterium]